MDGDFYQEYLSVLENMVRTARKGDKDKFDEHLQEFKTQFTYPYYLPEAIQLHAEIATLNDRYYFEKLGKYLFNDHDEQSFLIPYILMKLKDMGLIKLTENVIEDCGRDCLEDTIWTMKNNPDPKYRDLVKELYMIKYARDTGKVLLSAGVSKDIVFVMVDSAAEYSTNLLYK